MSKEDDDDIKPVIGCSAIVSARQIKYCKSDVIAYERIHVDRKMGDILVKFLRKYSGMRIKFRESERYFVSRSVLFDRSSVHEVKSLEEMLGLIEDGRALDGHVEIQRQVRAITKEDR